MIIYGANRRWQNDYFNLTFSNKRKEKNKNNFQIIIKLIKILPFIPPISLYHTYKLLKLKNKKAYSFYPAIPLNKNCIVALENYDSLFDYNSIKRFFYEPLIFLIIYFSKGKFHFYSKTSKKSVKKNFFTKKILARSKVIDFFKIKNKGLIEKCEFSKENIISFVGDFYLKGGMELIEAVSRMDAIENYKIILFIPNKQLKYVTELLKKYRKLNIIVKEINEYNPDEYYKTLMKTKIYIHPTFYDSHAIVAKEAKQLKCKTIVTDIFDSAREADIKIKPVKDFFYNFRLKIPYCGQLIIMYYSNPKRKINYDLVKKIEVALKGIL
jgi:hypothetical protein